nr:MAG: ORF1 [Torque teno virus]
MAWRWWWRRRPWRGRRRWRWRRRRRLKPRRYRRARRPARRTRVRRWRRRRVWGRRHYNRRRWRRRRKKKIVITQWNPSTVKKCVVKGYLPLLICGTGTTGTTYRNYGSHSNDYVKFDPFGGGFSTMQFTLQSLFEEYTKHHNTWSRSNQDLELVRYRGCRFKLYRHDNCDFIFTYNRKPPFTDSQLTGASLHPGILMTQRKKKIVTSYKTHPKGRATKTVSIRPPTLFTDKWYFQKDLCQLPLLTVSASAADLRFPFCSPQTDNPCIYFQVLHPWYNNAMSISTEYPKTNYEALISYFENKWSYQQGTKKKGPLGTVFNTFKTQEHIQYPAYTQYKVQDQTNANYYTKVSSLWGDHVYEKKILEGMKQNAQNMFTNREVPTLSGSQYLNFKTGLYSSIFLSNSRLAPDFPGFYWEVTYNPANDRGVGNKVWFDWCTKNDTSWKDIPGRVPIQDVPLWAAINGYYDYCKKYFHDPGVGKEGRLTIICPYTQPPLVNQDDPEKGFVPYDYNFGNTKMPDGNSYIPIEYRFKWYPCMFHQQNFMNDIVQCGPFAYHGTEKSVTLTCKYKFTFLFGGNPIPQQTIKDPCKQPTFPIPLGGGLPRDVQVENPKLLHEGYFFRAWDTRRGYFGEKAIKRMQEKQTYAEFFAGPPKRPRFEVPAIQGEDSGLLESKYHPWQEDSQTETESETEVPEQTSPTQAIQLQLQRQLQQQRKLGRTVKCIIQQLVKTQHHLHVPIIH